MPQVFATGSSVVVVLDNEVVVLLAGPDKHQNEALAAAARYGAQLASLHGVPGGRDVAVFSRNAT